MISKLLKTELDTDGNISVWYGDTRSHFKVIFFIRNQATNELEEVKHPFIRVGSNGMRLSVKEAREYANILMQVCEIAELRPD